MSALEGAAMALRGVASAMAACESWREEQRREEQRREEQGREEQRREERREEQ